MASNYTDLFNTEITEEQNEKFYEIFKELREMLPFGIGVLSEEKRKLPVVGKTRTTLINNVNSIIDITHGVLPPSFDKEKLKKNITMMKQLENYIGECKIVLEILSDTHAVLSADIFKRSVLYKQFLEASTEMDMPYDEMVKKLDYMPKYKKRKVIDEDL